MIISFRKDIERLRVFGGKSCETYAAAIASYYRMLHRIARPGRGMPLVTAPTYVPTRAYRLVTRLFTFIICRFTAGSHYRMQIRGVPKAEGQSRRKGRGAGEGFSKNEPRTGFPRMPPTTRQG